MTRRRSIGEHFARRRRIVAISARYSRFVGLMKVVLPMSAVALAVLVVAWPYLAGREEGFHLSFADIGVDATEAVYMTNARFFGSDDKRQPISVTADSVTQEIGDPDTVRFILPKADILLENGDWLALTAERGTLHRAGQLLALDGGVNIFFDKGYEFRTERAEIDLRTRAARGDAPVEGQGPLGLLNASGFRLGDKGRTIHFDGRVRLVLYPNAGS